MTSETKRHIDAARQVLVGVVPNPTSQIDQITNALIYKFMDDMDQASIKAGGKPAFFVDDLEKYAWTLLMDPRMGNQERMNLYSEALIKFSQAKQLPELFRGIFKSAFLPYRSPETLGLFLKEIDYFDYSHPEELGNAYEYLLSIMSSQGDAGQFRTPRHIIDFIVDVVNPTKDDKVLDPACGTGGFLISSYKHILEQHDGRDDPKKTEKPLTPDQRRKLMANFEGYDIDPTMVRIAQVNMYLHQFKNPKIFQYDSLSSEERWSDKFDVILANPPFMSPKGGIRPHSKFSVQSSRSEVLFVDYIINHLRPKGRAGIIVPEGIIFQSANAYKELRKKLIEDGLFAVVSLPSGVFNPYSGVKTSILLFDAELGRQQKEILFVRIENDGFDLGAQRREKSGSNLSEAAKVLLAWRNGKKIKSDLAHWVSRKKIAENEDYNLSGDRYLVATDYSNAKWPIANFSDVVSTITPPLKISKNDFGKSGSFPIIDQSQEEIAGWTDNDDSLVKLEKPVVIFGDHTCAVKYTEKSFAQGADGIKILLTNDQLIPKFLYYVLKNNPVESEGYQRHFAKLKRYKIPLPPIEIQKQIVAELDGYVNIISGAKQIVENWKPKIEIDPAWNKVKIGEVTKLMTGGTPLTSKKEYYGGDIKWLVSGDIHKGEIFDCDGRITRLALEESNARLLPLDSVLIALNGQGKTRGTVAILRTEAACNQSLVSINPEKDKLLSEFLLYVLRGKYQEIRNINGDNQRGGLNMPLIRSIEIPIPSLKIQKQIVEKIEAESALVESNKKLIEIYEQKTKDTISKLW